MKKVLLTLTLLFFSLFFANAQVSCPVNIDFELGNYSYWHYYTGTCCPLTSTTYSGYGTPDTSRITLCSGAGTDPCCTFPVVPPGGGAYTLKIGNASAGSGSPHSQKARYNVHVPATGAGYRLFYRTATVLQDAGHVLSQQPRLEIRLIDSATGAVLPCHNYDVTTAHPMGTYSMSACGSTPVKCKAWSTHCINLSAYAGSVVGVEFATSDCGVDGHFGYAYIDLNCGLMATSATVTCGTTTTSLYGPPGFAYYTWFDSSTFSPALGTTQNISIPNPTVTTTYACITTPYPGFGCLDTFYVTVYPLPSSFTAGTVNATASTACITSDVSVLYMGGTTMNFQWESSPDSVTWTIVPGATNSIYNIGGVGATTYYRMVATCAAASYSYTSPGKKITYASCCPGCELLILKLYNDLNTDCIREPGETVNYAPLAVRIDSNGVGIDTISMTSSLAYHAYGPTGTVYTFSLLPAPLISSCSAPGISYTVAASPGYAIDSLGLMCSGVTSVPNVSIYTTVASGRHFQGMHIFVSSDQCLASGVTVSALSSPKYFPSAYYNGYPSPISVLANSMTWSSDPLSVASMPAHFTTGVEKGMPWLVIGDTVQVRASGFAVTGGEYDSIDNFTFHIDTVRSSYDPNYITVLPSKCFEDTTLLYSIHFENLGNDTAYNVYILDTLADELDVNTLRIKLASAAMSISVFKGGGHNIVKFDFPNIKLLDSSWKGLNDGAVFYSIDPLPGLAPGTNVGSRAGIYFDDNEVVLTNAANILKGCSTPGINQVALAPANSKVEIFPNPAKDELIIKSEAGVYKSFSITNTIGQVMMQQDLASPVRMVNIKSLPAGMYYVTVKADDFSTMLKFIKE